ncbi:hypothetical protein [Streptomyces sp. YIM 121038]|uniref:hypothetical protein n=1 Tax=Streptomyces sp. YIM 121038 TaxID=2136401 RepID=UPI001110A7A1|nr:hypothetical protein [Streptomyces sp. YIM 121038]
MSSLVAGGWLRRGRAAQGQAVHGGGGSPGGGRVDIAQQQPGRGLRVLVDPAAAGHFIDLFDLGFGAGEVVAQYGLRS